MVPRMVQKVDLGFGSIAVNRKLTSEQLDRKARKMHPDDKRTETTVGLWVFDDMTIYVARDLAPRMQWRILIHELAEALFELAELKPYNHKTVLLLENIIANLLMNKKLVQGYWRSQDATGN